MGWVVLGRVGSRLFTCGGLGSVRSTTAKVLKISKDYVDAFKARLDKIWLHQAVKFVSCIGLGRVGSEMLTCSGLGWVESVS